MNKLTSFLTILILLIGIQRIPGPGGTPPSGGGGGGTVAFDAVGPSSSGADVIGSPTWTSPLTLSWTHTCIGTCTETCTNVAIDISNDAGFTVTVTDGGVSMPQIDLQHSNGETAGFNLVNCLHNPPTGANTILVTVTAALTSVPIAVTGGSISFTGASGVGTPVHATGSGTIPTVNVTLSTGQMVFDGVCNGSSITSSNQTQRWLNNAAAVNNAGNAASSTATGSGSITMSYSVSSDNWAIIAVPILN